MQHGYALLAVESAYRPHDLRTSLRVEHRGRFVEYDAARLHRDNAGDSHPLLLSARQLMRRMARKLGHSHSLERSVYTGAYLLRRNTEIFGSERNILLDNSRDYLVIGILKHHSDIAANSRYLVVVHVGGYPPPVYHYPAAVGQQDHIEQLGKRRFARTVMPEHRDKGPLLNIEVDPVQYLCSLAALSVLI